jgi:exopolyphosphatase / guanosine-5'-triphosphate,3'-diphosphate pyrophosphatase
MSISTRIIAAIDIGTNSIHMVVAKVSDSGFEVIAREKDNTRLGEGGGDMKMLSPEAIERGIEALGNMRRIADAHRASVFAVATSAVREAKNSSDFVDRVSIEAGIDIEVISGVEEARLIHLGVLQALPLSDKRSLLIDIGGGSTEVVIFDHTEELFVRSFKIGAVRLSNRFFPYGSTHPASVPSCSKFIASTVEPVRREVVKLGHEIAIVSSGTGETLARMCWMLTHNETPRSMNGVTFSFEELRKVTAKIVSSSMEERAKLDGLDADRVDIILAGALILDTLATSFSITSFMYCDYALREGVLLDAAQRLDPDVNNDLHNVAIQSARKLAERCDDDPSHSLNVSRLSCMLFDELSHTYELDPHHRLYLEAAAVLANVGLVVAHARHHLHTYYIVRNADLIGFTDHEIELIAQIARYHRKSEPKLEHSAFAALSEDDQHTVRMLSAILRIAIGLDRTHDGRTTSVSVTQKNNSLHLILESEKREDLDLNLYATQQRVALLAAVFECNVTVAIAT